MDNRIIVNGIEYVPKVSPKRLESVETGDYVLCENGKLFTVYSTDCDYDGSNRIGGYCGEIRMSWGLDGKIYTYDSSEWDVSAFFKRSVIEKIAKPKCERLNKALMRLAKEHNKTAQACPQDIFGECVFDNPSCSRYATDDFYQCWALWAYLQTYTTKGNDQFADVSKMIKGE